VIRRLLADFDLTMALAGARSLDQINRSMLRRCVGGEGRIESERGGRALCQTGHSG